MGDRQPQASISEVQTVSVSDKDYGEAGRKWEQGRE